MITAFREEYDFLSNMYPCRIEFQGLVFPSVENAYQAMKCANPDEWYQFINIKPGEAKKLGRKVQMRADFNDIKYNLMKKLLDIKFDSNPDLKNRLLATAPESLVEGNWWHDNYWGMCQCDKCKNEIKRNTLGELLQRKRNLSMHTADVYTVYMGTIYHRASQRGIEHPAFLYDEDGFVLLKIGEFKDCEDYMQRFQDAPGGMFKSLRIFEFGKHLTNYEICEMMNMSLQCTGYIQRITLLG